MLLFYDFEVFKFDWLVCIGDMENRVIHKIVNDESKLMEFFNHNKDKIWIGFNCRHYDQYILKAILCGLDPYEVSKDIVENKVPGWCISKMFHEIKFLNYDCRPNLFGLKKLEGFMGSMIKESDVSFDIDRSLTKTEIEEVIKYCEHDVRETYKVFRETVDTFNSHIAMLKEFKMPISYINKTPTRLTSILLNAKYTDRDDEFDIEISNKVNLKKYKSVIDNYIKWSTEIREYGYKFEMAIGDLICTYGFGGLHGALPNYVGSGKYLLIDVGSYYPALLIEHKFLSRNVQNPDDYKALRDDRIRLKKIDKKRANVRKIPLNGTFGASKDKNNPLYDPRQSNNTCINGQLFLTELLENIVDIVKIIQANTDGILVEITSKEQEEKVIEICKTWERSTYFNLDYEYYTNIAQRDVNNYILWESKDNEIKKIKQKGYYKKRTKIDNQLPIVNEALINYFVHNIPVESTINGCNELIKFQFIANIGSPYECLVHNGKKLKERVVRCFASKNLKDTSLFKRKKIDKTNELYQYEKYRLEHVSGVPNNCYINNDNIINMKCDKNLDKQWYINYTKYQIALLNGNNIDVEFYLNILNKDYKKGVKGDHRPQELQPGINKIKYNPTYWEEVMLNMLGCVIEL